MAIHCDQVLQAVRDMCPPRFALDGDATGLQIGTSNKKIERVLCTLDLTLQVAEEARDLGAGLIVSHHAVVFRPLKHLRTDDFKVKIVETLLKHDVAVYVPHTAMDVVTDGMNDHLAASVGLLNTEPVKTTGQDAGVLLVSGMPDNAATLLEWLSEQGATATEVAGRLEVVTTTNAANKIARKLKKTTGADPRWIALGSDGVSRGIGRIGKLAQPESLRALASRLKGRLGAPGVRLAAADPDQEVTKVAVLGGDGRSFVNAAMFKGAQVLITGDIDHHSAIEAKAKGIALIDVGHWAGEKQVSELLVAGLSARLEGEAVEVLASKVDTNPFEFV
ncbi:Nif3-like dinuclear metal center hexameric protein [Planctomycetota bacterium]|nr:Nif3-like dinuclear metal center hexameric protein [Planctomycetota bacterium]